MLFGLVWAVALIYCGYLLVLKMQDARRLAIIDANRTRNDIVADNMYMLERALKEYGDDHAFRMPSDLEELVKQRYIRAVPVNPFTGQPTRLVRFSQWEHLGEITAVMGREAYYDKEDRLESERAVLLIACYGSQHESLTKYRDYFPNAFTDHRRFGFEWLPEELSDQIMNLSGRYTSADKRIYDGRYECTPLEECLRAAGYILPIQMQAREVAVK